MRAVLFLILLYSSALKGQSFLPDSIVQINTLRANLLFLSQDSLEGRLTGSKGAATAAAFIASGFDSMGLKPFGGTRGFFDSFTAEFDGKKISAQNVIGCIPGKITNDTMVIFSAHYDHIGQKDDMPFNKDYTRNDDIFNGANDNATGVCALLEIARYYKSCNDNRYLLLFAAFSGEEMEMLGSDHLAKKIKPGVIKAVINLEMLGRPVTQHCFVVSFRNGPIRNMLNRSLKKYQAAGESDFFQNDPYPDEELFRRSDHYPFSRKVKNAFTIMGSSPEDKYYHSVDDEYETIDLEFLLKAIKNIALGCETFIK